MTRTFSLARLPCIEFGQGVIRRLPDLIAGYGKRLLLVTGAKSFSASDNCQALLQDLERRKLEITRLQVDGEPSPQLIDDAVKGIDGERIDVVVAVGGGSALDAAKAIAGLLKVRRSVMDFLEGVGPELPYDGPATPYIAVPTTAGTGSEATKNAVLSVRGSEGFKKSFRDERLVAQYAVVDPDLLTTCPQSIIAANGMDALTQLIESYVSSRFNAFTDALCVSGLRAVKEGLLPFFDDNVPEARYHMAYASLVSGVCLAQTGLGSVHGLASPLGAFHPLPHGVVCGTLVATATRVNIESMRDREPHNPALQKYAQVSELLCGQGHSRAETAHAALQNLLEEWTERLSLPRLSAYGVDESHLDRIVTHSRGSSMKTNPIVLMDQEIRSILVERL